jgi:ethanolaminephosphotransferase
LPRWLAPNLITLTGLTALITAYSVIAAHTPDFERPAPSWMYLMAGCAVFFYLHMDALDGKQARRTKTSSPLGQLFDHGCDALAVHLILTVMITSLQLGHEWKAIVSMMYVCIPWWMAHWEEYHTGVMSYGNGLWGVTEANYAVVLLHAYTYVVGPTGWTAKPFAILLKQFPQIAEYLPSIAVKFLDSLRGSDCFLLFFFFLGISLFQEQVRRVVNVASTIHSRKSLMTKKERGNKTLGPKAAAYHLLQILFTCGCGAALMSLPTTVPGEARVLMATFGVTYALQATRLIMAHMAKEPFSVAVWPLVLQLLQVANYFVKVLDPVVLAYAVNSIILTGYLHYVIGMTNEICAYLGIRALTIKPAMD